MLINTNTEAYENSMPETSYFPPASAPAPEWPIACNRRVLCELLLQQWNRLTKYELEKTRYIKHQIALLIERKYGINHILTENYLSNLERTLPMSV